MRLYDQPGCHVHGGTPTSQDTRRQTRPESVQISTSELDFTDAELAAYVAETLAVPRSVALEQALRSSETLRRRVSGVVRNLEDAAPGIGEIWRRRGLSCPTRETWRAYVADGIHGEFREYLRFHLDVVGCRRCAANVDDLRADGDPAAASRVRKFFETSVGRLKELPVMPAELPPS